MYITCFLKVIRGTRFTVDCVDYFLTHALRRNFCMRVSYEYFFKNLICRDTKYYSLLCFVFSIDSNNTMQS
jgi:hypothetical protein